MADFKNVLTSGNFPSSQEKVFAALMATKNRSEKLEVLHQSGLFVGQDFKVGTVYDLLTHPRPPANLVTAQEWELIHFLTPGQPFARLKRRWNECREEIKLQLDIRRPNECNFLTDSYLPMRFYKPPRVVMSELRGAINPHPSPPTTVPKVPYFA